MTVHGPSRLCFKPLKLLNLALMRPDPAFSSNDADPDLASKNNADQVPQPCQKVGFVH
jgi:hypothetical protein